MLTERMIINALIIGASFILVPFVISSALTFDYTPALFCVVLLGFIVAFFFLKDTLCIWPLLGGSIAGSLNFLPLPLTATHIFCILLIFYYITGYILIKQKLIKLGKTKFLWPILIITLILLYHNHTLNVRILGLGGETEGAKPAILIYLVIFAYFCGINIATPSVDFLSKVPLYSVIISGLSSIPFLLTTYIPSLAPYVFSVTDSVNVEAYTDAQSGGTGTAEGGGIGRLGIFGGLGAALQLYLLCYYPIGTWLRPTRWWVAGLSFICLTLAVASGYRSILFGFASFTMIGAWCYYSWRALFLPAALYMAAIMLFIASSNNLIHVPENKLPMIAQRTLSFLPGDWDQEALESARASNFFRKNIQDVYIKEYLKKSPWIGNGFSINTKEFNHWGDAMKDGTGGRDPDYITAKIFIEGKLFHTGWISVYDIVGIIGAMAFVALGWIEICTAAHFVFGTKADHRSSLFPFYVWLLCSITSQMVGFFTVFGDFSQCFMGLCVYAMTLSHLLDVENTTEAPIVLSERKGQVEFTGLKGELYGYHSRP